MRPPSSLELRRYHAARSQTDLRMPNLKGHAKIMKLFSQNFVALAEFFAQRGRWLALHRGGTRVTSARNLRGRERLLRSTPRGKLFSSWDYGCLPMLGGRYVYGHRKVSRFCLRISRIVVPYGNYQKRFATAFPRPTRVHCSTVLSE